MRLIIIISMFLISCATTTEIKKLSIEVNLYKLAKERQSCAGFRALKEDKSFPLKELATIQILSNCDLSVEEFKFLTENNSIAGDHYLRSLYAESALPHAQKFNLFEKSFVYGEEVIKSLKIKSEKEQLAYELLQFIKKSKLKSLINASEDLYYRYAPRKIQKPQDNQLYAKARDYDRVREFKNARYYYQKIIDSKSIDDITRMKAYYRKAMTYKLARDKETYSRVLMSMMFWIKREKLDEKSKNNRYIYNDIWKHRLLSIRARWTNGLSNKALEQIDYYLETFKEMDSETKAELYLVRGQIYREKKKYVMANRDFALVLEQENVNDETLEKASWSLAWNYYLTEQYNEAIEAFDKLISKSESFEDIRKHYYWQARALEKIGKKNEANDRYEKLSDEDSFGYYGILATYHLKKIFSHIKFNNYPPRKTNDLTLRWLKALGEDELVKTYLKKKKDYQSYSDFHYAHWYDGGLFHFFKLDDEKKEKVYRTDLPLAYPTPFKEDFIKAAELSKMPLSFLYSIARQESAFNPYARSWADAFGLLQVTPEKAKKLSKRYKIPYKSTDDLYTPEINVPLGSFLLKELTEKTNGEFISVVGSYNAGRKPVSTWYKTRFREDPIEFIEQIPYKETKTYVKLIFRNYIIYSRLLGEDTTRGIDLFYSSFL